MIGPNVRSARPFSGLCSVSALRGGERLESTCQHDFGSESSLISEVTRMPPNDCGNLQNKTKNVCYIHNHNSNIFSENYVG
ncbi:hypothetical protein J6590_055021 [Homalodisca vitripennis]|nr:hypothetical protein J6590_055021 [Homalodisca vitripennis]